MSRLAREHPEDESYQSLSGQYDRLVERHDLGAGEAPYAVDVDDRAKEARQVERQEALEQDAREK